jgi:enoyl-CoA hydratase/carnithine racemase
MTTDILTTRRGAVLEIGFNRPARKNALTHAMYEALAAAVRAADGDAGVRAILFHGSPETFTAGNDVADFIERPPQGEDAPVFRFIVSVLESTKPLVAAVNGPAVGIGTTLLLHCDLVYAGDNARFSLPFTQLGLLPEFASSYVLPLVAGYHRAAELLLLGEPFGPDAALAAGFVTRVVPAAETLATARAAADKLCALPPKSIRVTRALMREAHREAIAKRALDESGHFRDMLHEPAAREALTAFMEKRKPDFSRES